MPHGGKFLGFPSCSFVPFVVNMSPSVSLLAETLLGQGPRSSLQPFHIPIARGLRKTLSYRFSLACSVPFTGVIFGSASVPVIVYVTPVSPGARASLRSNSRSSDAVPLNSNVPVGDPTLVSLISSWPAFSCTFPVIRVILSGSALSPTTTCRRIPSDTSSFNLPSAEPQKSATHAPFTS